MKKLIPTFAQTLLGCLAAALAAVFLTSLWYFSPSANDPEHLGQVFLHYGVVCYGWAFLLIAIWPVVNRIGWNDKRIFSTLFKLFLFGIACAAIHYILSYSVVKIAGWISGHVFHGPTDSWSRFFAAMQSNLFLYVIIASICLAVSNEKKFRERSLRASKLESQLATAKLESLQAQLQPHFLFNSLNAIASLTQHDPETAEAMIVKLSDLLRSTLDLQNNELHCLEDEVNLARKYLSIEKLRFGKKMTVEYSIPTDTASLLVPTLIVQPLVENAIRHGVSLSRLPCTVSISATKRDNRLLIVVQDNCRGSSPAPPDAGGVGLANCEGRLSCLYGDDYEFVAEPIRTGGFRVSITISCHRDSTRHE